MQPIRITLLAAAVILIAVSAIAIACAPAAPDRQSGESDNATTTSRSNGNEATQPYQNTENESVEQQAKPEWTPPPPPTGPAVKPVVNTNLQRKLAKHVENKANKRAAGENIPTVYVELVITVQGPEHVDALVEFMNEHATGWVSSNKYDGTNRNVNGAIGRIDLDLVPTVEAMPGVIEIYEVIPARPASQLQQGVPSTTSQPAKVLGADTWHTAGIKGTGTEVGIIDSDFRNLDTKVKNQIVQGSQFFCYDSNGTPTQTNFAACETPQRDAQGTPVLNPHGTEVVKAFLEIAPDATLYISNANTADRVKFATEWLTAKNSDNSDSGKPYDRTTNNDYNVKVINWSAATPWDGPGDGTSASASTMEISPLDTLDQAVTNGAVWVNAAGNGARRTWFKRSPDLDFNPRNYLEFSSTGTDKEKQCSSFTIEANTAYTFQLRWAGLWPGADINLNLHLFGPIVPNTPGQFVASQNDPQSGQQAHYPREVLLFNSGSATGTYCLYVSKDPSDADPAWIQLQIFGPDIPLTPATSTGSIDNPAESNNAGMLAVGATDNMATPTIKDFSARGPAPEPYPPERTKPDVVSINTANANLVGTSLSSPRIAGLAALVIQALGNRDGYNEPHEIVNYLKTKAVPLGTGRPNNDYGYGLAKLPGLDDPPTNLVLTHQPCNREEHLLLTMDPPDWDGINEDGTNVRYTGFARLDPSIPGEVSQVGGIPTVGEDSLSFTTVRDATYYAVAQICPLNGSSRMCSIPSQRSNHITVPPEVCAPEHVSGVPGDGMLTVRWNHERHATGYDVQQEHGTPIEVLEDQHKVFSNLTNGTTYRFRVRAKGVPGTSEWSEWMTAIPGPAAPTKVQQIGSYSNSGIYIKMYWDETPGNAIYRVQQWDRTAKSWRRLPYTEKGQAEEYQIHFFYQYAGAEAKVTGLTPGKTYTYRFKSLNGSQESDWSDQVNFTAGPIRLHPDHTPTPNKSEPRDLAATVSGTNVVLNWTKGENENFATQVVRRKTHEGGPTITEFSVTLDAETYTDTTTVSGTTYIYRIANVKNNDVDVISNYQYITVP